MNEKLDKPVYNEFGLDTFIIDYRGYGQSEGKPGEKGCPSYLIVTLDFVIFFQ